jgi:transposase
MARSAPASLVEDLMHSLHPQARTTPAVRQEIARSTEPTGVLAQRFSVSTETIRKWRKRGAQDCQDHSSRPHKLPWKATEEERAIVCALRQATGFPLDDLTFVVSHFLPHLNRDAVYRILKAEGLGRLPPAQQRQRKSGTFKDYDLGFVHMDIKHLPKLQTANGERRKRYLYGHRPLLALGAPGGQGRRADHQRGRVPERGDPRLPLQGHARPDGPRILLHGGCFRGRLPPAEAGAPQDQAVHAADEWSRGALQRAGAARGARHHHL